MLAEYQFLGVAGETNIKASYLNGFVYSSMLRLKQ